MLATYMRRMRNNNLEIRIAGSSCRPQLNNKNDNNNNNNNNNNNSNNNRGSH